LAQQKSSKNGQKTYMAQKLQSKKTMTKQCHNNDITMT